MADIEIAQSLKAESEKAKEEMIETVPHPVDQDYKSLKCNLTILDKKSKDFKVYLIFKMKVYTTKKGLDINLCKCFQFAVKFGMFWECTGFLCFKT